MILILGIVLTGAVLQANAAETCSNGLPLSCWICDEASEADCFTHGRYEHCSSGNRQGEATCIQRSQMNGDGGVTRFTTTCGTTVECDVISSETCEGPVCTYCHGSQDLLKHTSTLDRDIAACGMDFNSNPCEEGTVPSDTSTGADQARRKRSLDTGVGGILVEVPKPHVKREAPSSDAAQDAGATQEAISHDVWCKTCDWTSDDDDCLANGQWTQCHDAKDAGAICVRESYIDETVSPPTTYIRRQCGERELCYPSAVHGIGHCGRANETAPLQCFLCGYGDPEEAILPEGSSVYRCEDPETAQMVCLCRGDPHCLTFDGKQLDLSGDCEYTFARDGCGDVGIPVDDATWHITATLMTNPKGTRSWVTSVAIEVGNKEVTIGQDLALSLDGVVLDKLPEDSATFGFAKIGNYYEVTLNSLGVKVLYNGKKNMQLFVPKSMEGSVCGLCGGGNGFGEDDNTVGPNEVCSGEEEGAQTEDLGVLSRSWIHLLDENNPKCMNECG